MNAQEALIDFLSGFEQLTEEEVQAIANNIPVEFFEQGTILQSEGEIPQECYYVLKGLVREYKDVEGTEQTIAFYSEKNGTISSTNYSEQTPSSSNLICVEDCLLINGNAELDKLNYEEFPILKEITREMLEADLNATKDKFFNFVRSSPKERYLHLLETEPDLLQRVPLHQIASYLGMTAESLSRIRKRITPDNKVKTS